jgi:glycosyltransferase involved in cell wall biosynthesis
MSHIGVVVIGRNEGERLVRCLNSVIAEVPEGTPIVYVDSGSTDGSVEFANALGIHVFSLDMSIPFTMARGRNTGFNFLVEHFPHLNYVQFIDGDCELLGGWLDTARQTLDQDDRLAVVCGRLHERFPEQSPYNRLADMEWNTPVGDTDFCGGIAMMRVAALKAVNGYNTSLICGEEPEMCIRLRQQGWKIRRIEPDMAIHDMAMTRFRQWWRRSIRGGWAVAEGFAMYGNTPERYMVQQSRSGWVWGILVPMLIVGDAWWTWGGSFLLLLGYGYLMLRVYQYRRQRGDTVEHSRLYAFFCVLSKIPQAIGQAKYWLTRWSGQAATIIEYKTSEPKSTQPEAPYSASTLEQA